MFGSGLSSCQGVSSRGAEAFLVSTLVSLPPHAVFLLVAAQSTSLNINEWTLDSPIPYSQGGGAAGETPYPPPAPPRPGLTLHPSPSSLSRLKTLLKCHIPDPSEFFSQLSSQHGGDLQVGARKQRGG